MNNSAANKVDLTARFRALQFVSMRLEEPEKTKLETFIHKMSKRRYKFRQSPVTSIYKIDKRDDFRGFLRLNSRTGKSFSNIALLAECSFELGHTEEQVNIELNAVPEAVYRNISNTFSDELAEYIMADYRSQEDSDTYSYHKLEILKLLSAYSISVTSLSKTILILNALHASALRGNYHSPMHFIKIADEISSKKSDYPIEWMIQLLE